MAGREFTIDDLERILREGAGADEVGRPVGDLGDITFDELGYDSLALLETGVRIEREFGIRLPDSAVTDVKMPRKLIDLVNDHLRLVARQTRS